jgi:hypothetical protein
MENKAGKEPGIWHQMPATHKTSPNQRHDSKEKREQEAVCSSRTELGFYHAASRPKSAYSVQQVIALRSQGRSFISNLCCCTACNKC